jgi:hypothetical protein
MAPHRQRAESPCGHVQSAHDGSGRLFIIEKYGVIRIYENGQLLDQPFLNIDDRVNDRGNEMGLLGLAFHPNYEQNGYFYVNYTGAADTPASRAFKPTVTRPTPAAKNSDGNGQPALPKP